MKRSLKDTKEAGLKKDGQATNTLRCHHCRYDLRGQPSSGRCPECGTSIAESVQMAQGVWPAWRDRDPCWRRRITIGAWILALVPLMDFLLATDLASSIPVPHVLGNWFSPPELADCYLSEINVFPLIAFTVGTALFFTREEPSGWKPLGWKRRWGLNCVLLVFCIDAYAFILFAALIASGIAALFMSVPLLLQPPETALMARLTGACLKFAPAIPASWQFLVVGNASVAMILACAAASRALRSGRSVAWPWIIVSPLLAAAVWQLLAATWLWLSQSDAVFLRYAACRFFFSPHRLIGFLVDVPDRFPTSDEPLWVFVIEAVKWLDILFIAVTFSVLQISAAAGGHKRSAERDDFNPPANPAPEI